MKEACRWGLVLGVGAVGWWCVVYVGGADGGRLGIDGGVVAVAGLKELAEVSSFWWSLVTRIVNGTEGMPS